MCLLPSINRSKQGLYRYNRSIQCICYVLPISKWFVVNTTAKYTDKDRSLWYAIERQTPGIWPAAHNSPSERLRYYLKDKKNMLKSLASPYFSFEKRKDDRTGDWRQLREEVHMRPSKNKRARTLMMTLESTGTREKTRTKLIEIVSSFVDRLRERKDSCNNIPRFCCCWSHFFFFVRSLAHSFLISFPNTSKCCGSFELDQIYLAQSLSYCKRVCVPYCII